MRRLIPLVLAGTTVVFLARPLVRAQDQDFEPTDHQAMLSGGSTNSDTESTSPGPKSSSSAKRPPRVGPNIRVNDPQQAFPNGLLGRSETTIAATDDGATAIGRLQ